MEMVTAPVSTRHSMRDRTVSVATVDSKKTNATRRMDSPFSLCAFTDASNRLEDEGTPRLLASVRAICGLCGSVFSGSSHSASFHQRISSSVVPVNTVPACTEMAMVGRRLFGLFTHTTRMSERPQLGSGNGR